MELTHTIRGEKYTPEAKCPNCTHNMTPAEILHGFNRDTNDFTTCCSHCRLRFEPLLVCSGRSSKLSLPFYCDCQTLQHLRGKAPLAPDELLRKYPAIYHSAIIHYGNLNNAFKQIQTSYEFKENYDWENKVLPFLGQLPDTVIAQCANVSVGTIKKIRKGLGIEPYSRQRSIQDLLLE